MGNHNNRRSIRLKGYDYHEAGAYFVTLCTEGRECVMDDPIVRGIIEDTWRDLPTRFPSVHLDEFIIMPNHIHFVIWLTDVGTPLAGVQGEEEASANRATANRATANRAIANPATANPATANPATANWATANPATANWATARVAPTLGEVVGAFKSLVFRAYLQWVNAHDQSRRAKFWQRNYYEHIIRNERELKAIRQYILDNPANWEGDADNPQNPLRRPPPKRVDEYLREIHGMGD